MKRKAREEEEDQAPLPKRIRRKTTLSLAEQRNQLHWTFFGESLLSFLPRELRTQVIYPHMTLEALGRLVQTCQALHQEVAPLTTLPRLWRWKINWTLERQQRAAFQHVVHTIMRPMGFFSPASPSPPSSPRASTFLEWLGSRAHLKFTDNDIRITIYPMKCSRGVRIVIARHTDRAAAGKVVFEKERLRPRLEQARLFLSEQWAIYVERRAAEKHVPGAWIRACTELRHIRVNLQQLVRNVLVNVQLAKKEADSLILETLRTLDRHTRLLQSTEHCLNLIAFGRDAVSLGQWSDDTIATKNRAFQTMYTAIAREAAPLCKRNLYAWE